METDEENFESDSSDGWLIVQGSGSKSPSVRASVDSGLESTREFLLLDGALDECFEITEPNATKDSKNPREIDKLEEHIPPESSPKKEKQVIEGEEDSDGISVIMDEEFLPPQNELNVTLFEDPITDSEVEMQECVTTTHRTIGTQASLSDFDSPGLSASSVQFNKHDVSLLLDAAMDRGSLLWDSAPCYLQYFTKVILGFGILFAVHSYLNRANDREELVRTLGKVMDDHKMLQQTIENTISVLNSQDKVYCPKEITTIEKPCRNLHDATVVNPGVQSIRNLADANPSGECHEESTTFNGASDASPDENLYGGIQGTSNERSQQGSVMQTQEEKISHGKDLETPYEDAIVSSENLEYEDLFKEGTGSLKAKAVEDNPPLGEPSPQSTSENLEVDHLIKQIKSYLEEPNLITLASIVEILEKMAEMKTVLHATENSRPKISALISKLLKNTDGQFIEELISKISDTKPKNAKRDAEGYKGSLKTGPEEQPLNIVQWYSTDDDSVHDNIFVKEEEALTEKKEKTNPKNAFKSEKSEKVSSKRRESCSKEKCSEREERKECRQKKGEYLSPKVRYDKEESWKKSKRLDRSERKDKGDNKTSSMKERSSWQSWLLERGKGRDDLRRRGGKNRYFKSTGMLMS